MEKGTPDPSHCCETYEPKDRRAPFTTKTNLAVLIIFLVLNLFQAAGLIRSERFTSLKG
jgi:hypothetical protein